MRVYGACLVLLVFLVSCTSSGKNSPREQAVVASSTATLELAPNLSPSERGEILFGQFQSSAGFSCSACHLTSSERRLVGPGLKNVRLRAVGYEVTDSAEDYLRESILHPEAYIVEGYPENVMPRIYGQFLSESQVNDLIAYLLSL